MYFEYDTKWEIGQEVYTLNEGIKSYIVKSVEVRMFADKDKETCYVHYSLKEKGGSGLCTVHGSDMKNWFSSKTDILKYIADQL